MVAPFFFWLALNTAAEALFRLRQERGFGSGTMAALKSVGNNLMLGTFAAVVVQPSMIFLIGNGFTEMGGVRFDLNVETVTIGLVGLVILHIALQRQKLQFKLDEFV